MSKPYTDDDVRTVAQAIVDHFNAPDDKHSTWWINPGVSSRAVLDAVAPAIAARALRVAAIAYGQARWGNAASVEFLNAETWLLDRAREIEGAS